MTSAAGFSSILFSKVSMKLCPRPFSVGWQMNTVDHVQFQIIKRICYGKINKLIN